MSDEIKNILSDNEDRPDEQELLKYLQGQLDADAQHELEQQITDSDFVSDAVEGLQSFKPGTDINAYVNELNRQLQQQINKKKERKARRRLNDQPWLYVAIVTVLLIILIGYWLAKKYTGQ